MTYRSNLTFFDFETTDKNPSGNEILTGYFVTLTQDGELLDNLYVEMKPLKWIEESFPIHGLSERRCESFPERIIGLKKMIAYMKKHKDSIFCCHANHLVFGVYGYFDWQCVVNEMFMYSDSMYYWFGATFAETRVISTHTIAKKLLGLNKNKLSDIATYYGVKFKHHDCKEDTLTTMHIYFEMIKNLGILTDDEIFDLGNYNGEKIWRNGGEFTLA